MVSLINDTIETPRRLTCVSRPRRFGKSFAAKMLCAYYDKTCDSACLVDDLAIVAEEGTYRQHLNKYDVIYLNLTSIMEEAEESELISFIKRKLIRELSLAYPQLKPEGPFLAALLRVRCRGFVKDTVVILTKCISGMTDIPSAGQSLCIIPIL